MTVIRFLKRALFFLSLAFLLFSLSGAVLVYTYQDQLVSRFIAAVNQKIDTPINAGNIEASWWEKFPDVSIILSEVIVDGSLPGPTDTLATASSVYCTFNAWDILRGRWIVDQIHFENGRLFLVQTELGDNNFTILNRGPSQKKSQGEFKLETIRLKEVEVTYLDLLRNQQFNLRVDEIAASLTSKGKSYDIELDGKLITEALNVGSQQYFVDKPLTIVGDIQYYQADKKWEFSEMEIGVNTSMFLVNGYYQGSLNSIDFSAKGHDTDVQTVLSLLPKAISKKFTRYKSRGEIYFDGRLQGSVANEEDLGITISFGCRNASFSHPDYEKQVEGVYLSGKYSSADASDPSKATLSLTNVRGTLEGAPFEGNLQIRNLRNYQIKGDLMGTLDLNSWQRFLPPGNVTEAHGRMQIDVSFEGPVKYLKTANSVDKFKTSGEIFVEGLEFSLEQNSLPFKDFNGHFLFNGRDLAISDFSGTIGNSDFRINGFFRNIIAFIFAKNQPIGIEADLQARNLDLDELLTGNTKARHKTVVGKQTYTSFGISPRLALTFNCNVGQLKFRRFRGHEIQGKLKISNQIAHGQQIRFETMGGKITMDGRVDGRTKDHIRVYTKSSYQGIYIDSLFYVFENFGQDFMEDKHLSGQAFADIGTYMAFDDHLRFKSSDLVVNAGLVIENGELNEFEPLQKLSPYLDSQDLRHLKFADLQNNVHIKDREIYLPNMVVESNVTTINVNGTHTFDQDIFYRLRVPIKSSKRDKDEYFGAIEDDGLSTNLFLKITGNTRDYQVAYDKEAVKDKIRHDLKEEKWEFRDAVHNKGVDDEVLELDEEDFFDFEEADSTAVNRSVK